VSLVGTALAEEQRTLFTFWPMTWMERRRFPWRRHSRTPNLDRLAASGAVLNALYAQPFSTQTRAAL
jgi:arylsulfatase A-like enzyme